jgi:S1-C subfamily serine protease
MKICITCGQIVAEEVNTCPSCGAEVAGGRTAIDDYRILEVLHEGYSSILCKAQREGQDEPVLIRIFTPPSGVDARLAERLQHELEELQALPETYFVRHLAIKQSAEGLWYRISEWVEALNWGTLLATGRLQDARTSLRLLYRIASILDGLHRIGHIIPHLILDDILVYEDNAGALKVMIDYKLSRFLDPQLDRPGPMLARLLALHPDIVNQRPLDHRSDIWSLGKAFVEILSADPDVADLQAQVARLPVPPEVQTLIRLMLSDDPDLRPRSMAEVAAVLGRVSDKAIQAAAERHAEATGGTTRAMLRRVNTRLGLLAVLLVVLIAAGGVLWYNLGGMRQDSETALMAYANQYAGSVAFVVVDYWLQQGDRKVYHRRSEGTAFLADDAGYLLTNRHVACPWLEDQRLMMIIGLLRQRPEELQFNYRIFLWFEGQRAFSRLPALSDSEAVEDIYLTESAFSSQGPQRVWIAGVAMAPVETWERVRSPLRDDFAVLKIAPVPPGLRPLPLASDFKAAAMPKLTPLITLGFPLGSQTQAATVNVSVTRGNVRRAFENMFQVDASLHPGNSGGPFIDSRGRVVGLAAIVAVGWADGPVPVATRLSDIGLVLPITKAAAFLEELKAGALKWNGEIDVTLEQRLQQITAVARRRDWEKARALADKELDAMRTPPLIMVAAMMHLCAGDRDGGRRLFDQILSIDPTNNLARLMILVTDWFEGRESATIHRQSLLALDWRSPDEFLGYLARILTGEVDAQDALFGGYTATEKSWLHLITGLIEERQWQSDAARSLLEKAVLAADTDDWSLYLALSQLDRIQRRRMAQSADPIMRQDYQRQIEAFDRRLAQTIAEREEQRARMAPLRVALQRTEVDLATQRSLLENLRVADSENNDVLITQAYYAAMDDDWGAALDYAQQFLALPGRMNAGKLSVGLLEPEILYKQGEAVLARERLEAYHEAVIDPWYRSLSGCLLDPALQAHVTAKAGESPETLLTGHTALGLWSEGRGDATSAIKHYREALGSYMDHRIEYDFAKARMRRLRQASQ